MHVWFLQNTPLKGDEKHEFVQGTQETLGYAVLAFKIIRRLRTS
jgi:hypothetical protein